MSVHACDRDLLAQIVRLARSIIAAPHTAPDYLSELIEASRDTHVALRCPGSTPFVGFAEAIVLTCLMALATKRLTTANAYRCAHGAQFFLEAVGENYFAAERAARGPN